MTQETHHIVGGGIAALAAAVFLVRDAGVQGPNIHIYEQLGVAGGSLDGAGEAGAGYLTRGGRMFEEHFQCTFDLLDTIPLADDPGRSVSEDIRAFNRMVPGSSNCRLVRDGRPAENRFDLTLGAQDIVDINRLSLHSERGLDTRRIDDWFRPEFFDSNFWLMWSTMFSFQPWHSVVEMRRYLRRFIHLFPGFTRIEGILRTRYNQYDSLIAPIVQWLRDRGVQAHLDRRVTDVEIVGDRQDRQVTALVLGDGARVEVMPEDRVYLTLGSMTDGSVLGDNDNAPALADAEGGAWALWRKLAARHEGLGRPEAFCTDTGKTAWHSFTVTLDGPDFFEFMEDFTGNRTGTGGLVTFAGSGWTLSIVLFHQPHFRGQKHGTYTLWGYGLRGDRDGDFVKKPMWQATGNEILHELFGQMRMTPEQRAWFDGARVQVCRMPFITSQFMPRRSGDRPDVRPVGARNFAVIGQFCEQPRDCVFTVEYSVRSARAAVASLTGRVTPPPAVARTDLDPMVLIRAARVLMGL
ncbi:oleate hydratase [Tropicibacter oceani]|uniref:Oleate hydratase n=1 Tax=Tropicibacter oceani TaxID=3058420 RepID=A0ABY8QER7_9RHOB|nr:oleate hydratase [Tropicibacter oceani]WGW02496.1 oleate hydratase [Tropicibacter oceani]